MHLVLVGLSHHHAPIEVRERLSCPEHALPGALNAAAGCPGVREVVLLFTCNRTEIYALVASPELESAYSTLRHHLSCFHGVPETVFAPHLYYKSEQEAVLHLTRVASGLDSLVLGEAQILGQVRSALQAALEAGTSGGALTGLFQQALTSGKRVQTETTLRQGSLSIGKAAVDLAGQIFSDLSSATVLIMGAGKMSELTARDLVANGVRFVVVANRTYDKAVELAGKLGGTAIQYDSFLDALATSDIVISSTAAPHPILYREMLTPVLRKRRGKPLFIIDIAVPRDIDSGVADLENVFLYNIDDLQEVAAEGAKGRAELAQIMAEAIAEEEAAKFLARYRTRAVTPIIAQLKTHLNQMTQNRLEILRARLGAISDRDWQMIETQMHSHTNEVLLEPILRLKQEAHASAAEAGSPPVYDLITAAKELFRLPDENSNTEPKSDKPTGDAEPVEDRTMQEVAP